jgi:hypothetical protein
MSVATNFSPWPSGGGGALTFLLGALLLGSMGARAADLTLDLTEARPLDDALPVIQLSRAGTSHGPVPAPTKLPLEITIEDIWPQAPSAATDTVEFNVLVRNVGKDPVAIPASTHRSDVGRTGNRDRAIMYIGLELTIQGNGAGAGPVLGPGETMVGSSSVPGSMLVLEPKHSVSIRMAGRFPEIGRWISLGPGAYLTSARAVLWEQTLQDGRYEERGYSADVVSRNAVNITVSWKP